MPFRYAARALGGTALISLPVIGAAGAYQYETDEGTRRSVYFWRNVLPMYLHYRWIQSRVQHLPEEEQDKAYQPLHEKYSPQALEIILHLKGFYIKIGQVGSTRHDFVPKEYLDKISTLQDNVPAQDFPYVKQVIEDTVGKPIYEIFSDFDHVPIGAASIGQVHHAYLKDGTEVAVKVMYPEVERLFRSDIETIKTFCRLAQPEHLPMIKEIEKQFLTEFDYRREARNLEMIRRHMAKRYGNQVVVPKALYCNKQVLIMQYLRGESLVKALQHNLEVMARLQGVSAQSLMDEMNAREARGERVRGASKSQIRRWRLYLRAKDWLANMGVALHNYLLRPATLFRRPVMEWRRTELPLNLEEMMDLLLDVHGHQILMDGCFNGDPHPGNMLLVGEKLGLVDCGQVKHINLEQRLQLARLLVAIAKKDKPAVVKYYTDMGFRTKYMDPDIIYKAACVAFDRDDKESLGGVNIQQYIEDLNRADPVLAMPDDFVLAARVAVLLRGLGYALKYHYSTAGYWAPMAQKLLTEYGDDVPDTV